MKLENTTDMQQVTRDVLLEKYCKGEETTADEIFERVARYVASAEDTEVKARYWEKKFLANLYKGAIGAGRIMAAAGTTIQSTLVNCFVQPVGDSMDGFDEDGKPGIYKALSMAAETMRRGGGVGYNFSAIRPKGALVRSTLSNASGPCSYMNVFDASCLTVESAGTRRGAQMGILNIDHPDIIEFITAKRTPGRWNNFNVSVGMSDAFMKAVEADAAWQLVHKAKPGREKLESGATQLEDGTWLYETVQARALLDIIMKSTYDFAEPGIIFLDSINRDNNLREVETIEATNPCVTGVTLILTSKGYQRIDSVVDQKVEIWNGFNWSEVTPTITGIDQQILDLEFSDGTKLACTPYHKFILNDGTRIEAKDLRVGTKLCDWKFPNSLYVAPGKFLTSISPRNVLEPKVYCFTEEKNHSGIFNGVMTAQCGEQPLPPYGCCDLGPIILTHFVDNPFSKEASFDYASFAAAVAVQTRFLDNVLDVTFWPLIEQDDESKSKRRLGIGFTGLGDALIMLGLKYDTEQARTFASSLARFMRDSAYNASVSLAKEKGCFPLFDANKYLASGTFASRLPEELQKSIRRYGIRNSHLLSIAPTGTVSLAFADNASNGIEPAFMWAYSRKKRMDDGTHKYYPVLDHAFREFLKTLPEKMYSPLLDAVVRNQSSFVVGLQRFEVKDVLPTSFVSAMEISAVDHMKMLEAVQPFIDSAISKTVNIPADYPFEDFKNLYKLAWRAGLKGLATYRPNATLGSVLSATSTPVETIVVQSTTVSNQVHEKASADVDPLYVLVDKRPNGDLEAVNTRIQYFPSGSAGQSMYVSISFADVDGVIDGQPVTLSRPLEVFIPGGQSEIPQEWISTFARQLSLNARSGWLAKALQDARQVHSDRGPVQYGYYVKADGTKVPRYHESEVGVIAYAIQQVLFTRGFLDIEGNQVSSRSIAKVRSPKIEKFPVANMPAYVVTQTPGKTCTECGSRSVIKKDGCEFCTNCGHTGSCG
jgi:ribonucleotide reductase alpha subunit